jgi:hypothetical protein
VAAFRLDDKECYILVPDAFVDEFTEGAGKYPGHTVPPTVWSEASLKNAVTASSPTTPKSAAPKPTTAAPNRAGKKAAEEAPADAQPPARKGAKTVPAAGKVEHASAPISSKDSD